MMNLDTVVQGRSRVNEGKRISQVTDQIWENHFEVWSDVAINYKGHWFSCRCFIRRGTHDIISHLPAYHNISKEREYVFLFKARSCFGSQPKTADHQQDHQATIVGPPTPTKNTVSSHTNHNTARPNIYDGWQLLLKVPLLLPYIVQIVYLYTYIHITSI